jgi:hypothetical protein
MSDVGSASSIAASGSAIDGHSDQAPPRRPCYGRNFDTVSKPLAAQTWVPSTPPHGLSPTVTVALLAAGIETQHRELAAVGPAQPLQAFHDRGLARSVGSQDPVDLTGGDLERHVIDRDQRPIGRAQALRDHCGLGHCGGARRPLHGSPGHRRPAGEGLSRRASRSSSSRSRGSQRPSSITPVFRVGYVAGRAKRQ